MTAPVRPSLWLAIAVLAFLAAGQMLSTTDTWFECVMVSAWAALALNALVRGCWLAYCTR